MNKMQKEMLLVLLTIITFSSSVILGAHLGFELTNGWFGSFALAMIYGAIHNFIIMFYIAGK